MSEEKIEILHLNGREATTVTGARKILNQRAKEELGQDRDYSRIAVYTMFVDGKIEGVHTANVNYYYLDSLRKAPIDQRKRTQPTKYTRRLGKERSYPQEIKDEAIRLYQLEKNKRSIARQLEVSNQTVNVWIHDWEQQQQGAVSQETLPPQHESEGQ